MADIIYVAVIVAFFALATLFVHACDRIIGPDEHAALVSGGIDDPVDPLAAVGGGDPEQPPVSSAVMS